MNQDRGDRADTRPPLALGKPHSQTGHNPKDLETIMPTHPVRALSKTSTRTFAWPRTGLVRLQVAALIAACGFGSQLVRSQELPVANRILIRVNERIVTQYEYEKLVASAMAALTAQGLEPDVLKQRRAELPKQILRSMWDDLLVLSRADQLGLSVSDFEVEEAITAQMKQFGLETRDDLAQALAQNGLTLEDFRSNLSEQMLQRKVYSRELFPRVQLEEDELRRVYRDHLDDYRTPESRSLEELVVLETEAGSQLDEVGARVANAWSRGDSPADIAEREGAMVRFIELGSVVKEELAPALGEVAFSLDEGRVGEPVVARGGLHIVRVASITPARVQTFEEVRQKVDEDERSRRIEVERSAYLAELEKKAYYEAELPANLADFRTSTGLTPGRGGLAGVSTSPLGIQGVAEKRPVDDGNGR